MGFPKKNHLINTLQNEVWKNTLHKRPAVMLLLYFSIYMTHQRSLNLKPSLSFIANLGKDLNATVATAQLNKLIRNPCNVSKVSRLWCLSSRSRYSGLHNQYKFHFLVICKNDAVVPQSKGKYIPEEDNPQRFEASWMLRYYECFPYIIISLYHLVLRY